MLTHTYFTENSALVATPSPQYGESMLGLLLRTSELNGYDSPHDLLEHAGLNEKEIRRLRFDEDQIKILFGMNDHKISGIPYTKKKGNVDNGRTDILGHEVNKLHLQTKNAKICPLCIKEDGYIDIFWDLKYSIGCPKHRRLLVTKCPGCNKPLSYQREGLLTCLCGSDLSKAKGEMIKNSDLLYFLYFLRKKLYSHTLNSNEFLMSGLPIKHLENSSFNSILSIIKRLSSVSKSAKSKINNSNNMFVLDEVEIACNALSRWPAGFHLYLREIGEALISENTHVISFRQQFSSFYSAFFCSHSTGEDVGFIRREFLRFGATFWESAVVDKRMMVGIEENRRMVGINDVAARMRVQPSTVKHLIKKGIIHVDVDETGARNKYLFDLNYEFPSRDINGKSFTAREAAKYIGLPVSVLTELRSQGFYKVRHIGNKIASYHEYDLQDLYTKVIGDLKKIDDDMFHSEKHISIDSCMRKKLGETKNKVNMIVAILNGDLIPYGRLEDRVGSIILFKSDVARLCEDMMKIPVKTFGVSNVAILINCDPVIVPELVKMNYLDSVRYKKSLRITEESLIRFSKTYISCARIAKLCGTNSIKVVETYKKEEIKLLEVKRSKQESVQCFVERKYLAVFALEDVPLFYECDIQH